MAKKKADNSNTVAQNRKARHDYVLLDEWEAGIVLLGSEVKSLRAGKAQIAESYITEEEGEIWMINSYIPEYNKAGKRNHEPRRKRKLLLHQREINKIIGKLRNKGLTMVPLSVYFNNKGIAKVKIALAQGKNVRDKRETVKRREWERNKTRLLKKK